MDADAPDRSQLRFVEAVEDAFGFLRFRGFAPVRREATLVRFESDRVFVNVYHGRRSYEMNVEVGRLGRGDDDRPYHLEALIRIRDAEAGARFRVPAVRTAALVRDAARELAALLQEHGDAVLGGDDATFARLDRERARWAHAYALEVRLSQVVPQADEAFRSGDYARAAQLLESVKEGLTDVQLKKLRYAHAHADRNRK
jgi:hypothetical protein